MLGLPMDSEQQAGPDQKLVLTPQTQTQVRAGARGAPRPARTEKLWAAAAGWQAALWIQPCA
jgi:hypothetical protein